MAARRERREERIRRAPNYAHVGLSSKRASFGEAPRQNAVTLLSRGNPHLERNGVRLGVALAKGPYTTQPGEIPSMWIGLLLHIRRDHFFMHIGLNLALHQDVLDLLLALAQRGEVFCRAHVFDLDHFKALRGLHRSLGVFTLL